MVSVGEQVYNVTFLDPAPPPPLWSSSRKKSELVFYSYFLYGVASSILEFHVLLTKDKRQDYTLDWSPVRYRRASQTGPGTTTKGEKNSNFHYRVSIRRFSISILRSTIITELLYYYYRIILLTPTPWLTDHRGSPDPSLRTIMLQETRPHLGSENMRTKKKKEPESNPHQKVTTVTQIQQKG